MSPSDEARPEEQERVVIRDNRKIDPVTGEARKPPPVPGSPASEVPETGQASEAGEPPAAEAVLLEERTRDLQRVQAEYANYRKRADRDRLAAGEIAVGRTLAELLPVLDDIDRAREHGDLTGALKAVADHLETVFTKLGLEPFGEVGDPFDPAVHEAVMHAESDDVAEPTCTTVLRKGYRHGERLLRPAMVGVTDPLAPPGLGDHPLDRGDEQATRATPATPEEPADPDDQQG
ncbi:MAG: molecular chaperone GrpE [Pseudonocardiales bacterium]|nr:molecular chaperone GrpE [Pseudonocardiales bacterium]